MWWDRNGLPKGSRARSAAPRGRTSAYRWGPSAVEAAPSVVRVERLASEERGVRVVFGRLVDARRAIRFAAAAAHPAVALIRPSAEIGIAFRAQVERLASAEVAGAPFAPPPLSMSLVAEWADRVRAGDPYARRLVDRIARDLAALCRAGGPERLLVALDAIEPGAVGPDRARYFVRGSLSIARGAGRNRGAPAGVLDAGPLRMVLDPLPLAGAAPGVECVRVEGIVRLYGLPHAV